jgi:hypothetical protein
VKAACLALVSLVACTSRTAIRPDQLPRVTEAAAADPAEPVDVLDEAGQAVELSGRFDAVSVTPGGGGPPDRFSAPIEARVEGQELMVRSLERGKAYALPRGPRVVVQRYNTKAAVVSGSILTGFGGLALIGGAVFMGYFVAQNNEFSGFGFVGGIPIMSVGLGLAGGGIPLLVAGTRENERFPPPGR